MLDSKKIDKFSLYNNIAIDDYLILVQDERQEILMFTMC